MATTLIEVLRFLIEKGPGRTETQLAEAIYAGGAYQQRVNQDCRILVNRRQAERRGAGRHNDPYRYYPINFSPIALSSHALAVLAPQENFGDRIFAHEGAVPRDVEIEF